MVKYFIYSVLVVGIVDFFASKYAYAGDYDYNGGYVYPYHFEIGDRFNSSAKWLYGPVDELWLKREHYPETVRIVDHKKAKEICRVASQFILIDFYENATDATLYEYFLNSQYPRTPLLKCSTVPPSYLKLYESGSDKVVIFTERNKYFEKIKFRADLVMPASEPKKCEQIVRNLYPDCTDEKFFKKLIAVICREDEKLLRTNRLTGISSRDRLDVCSAAQMNLISLSHNVPGSQMPVFLGSEVEPAQSFELKYKDKYKKKIVLRCPTAPRMYVYYSNSSLNSNDMHILLVNKPKRYRRSMKSQYIDYNQLRIS